MKVYNKIILLVALMSISITCMASQAPVGLGTTESFAVLAGSTITNTGTTVISGSVGGSVGVYPGTVFTGQASVVMNGGIIHLADTVATIAKDDLVTAYDDAAGRLNVTRIPSELGGTVLTPGTYDSADGKFQITGTLTLDAQGDPEGVFVFKTESTIITAANSNINPINGAKFCRIFWQVGSSATLGTNSHFVGHIFALTSITANTGATVQGQLLARNGAVTLDHNIIMNGFCENITSPAFLHVINNVVNDNGGKAITDDFIIHVKNSGSDVALSPANGKLAPGTFYTLPAGTYLVNVNDFPGYTVSYSGDIDANGNIVLSPWDNKTITITNNDVLVGTKVTVVGGQLPNTVTSLYKVMAVGVVLILIGLILFLIRKKHV